MDDAGQSFELVAKLPGWLPARPTDSGPTATLPALVTSTICSALAAPSQTVSLVFSKDKLKLVQHGRIKLEAAFQTKGISCEEAPSLKEAASPTVIVAGLASGAGEAAKLINELKLAPQDCIALEDSYNGLRSALAAQRPPSRGPPRIRLSPGGPPPSSRLPDPSSSRR